jgi:uncharacterized membrane protein
MNNSGKNMGMNNKQTESDGKKVVSSGSSNALAILNERYAKGELGREEYIKMREDIIKDD